ncbi:hypothetical protein ACWATR_37140 [Nostoc sp. UIC 10890]
MNHQIIKRREDLPKFRSNRIRVAFEFSQPFTKEIKRHTCTLYLDRIPIAVHTWWEGQLLPEILDIAPPTPEDMYRNWLQNSDWNINIDDYF